MTQLLDSEMTQTSVADANQFLTFTLNNQEFGVEILRVQEIRNFSQVTPIPNMPACIKGVMNLRGTVVPVVDLRHKFHMPTIDYNQFTVIVVVNVGSKVVGLVVDAVSDVLNLRDQAIQEAPDFGAGVSTQFIHGLVKSGESLVTLLNIDELLRPEELIPQS